MKFPLSCIVAGILTLVSACGRAPSTDAVLPPDALAIVGDSVITLERFKRELAQRPWCATREQRQALLSELIRQEILIIRAKAAGYDRDPELRAAFDRMIASRYEEDQTKRNTPVPVASEGAIREFYQANLDKFTAPEKIRVAMIFVKAPNLTSPEKEETLKSALEAIRREARQLPLNEPAFGRLALKYSEDQATRYVGGDCGWFSRNDLKWDPEVQSAMLRLEAPGEVSDPVRARNGFYLLKLMDRRAAEAKPLEQIRDLITYELGRQREQTRRDAWDQEQRAGLRVELRPDLLRAVLAPGLDLAASSSAPPRMPAR